MRPGKWKLIFNLMPHKQRILWSCRTDSTNCLYVCVQCIYIYMGGSLPKIGVPFGVPFILGDYTTHTTRNLKVTILAAERPYLLFPTADLCIAEGLGWWLRTDWDFAFCGATRL